MAKGGKPGNERVRVDDDEGKFAMTEYTVVDHAAGKAAFTAFWPRTGRTHQIRVHAELMGCPILGDPKYKGHGEVEPIEGLDFEETLHLHAQRLIVKHPARAGFLDITAPLPSALRKTWKALGFNPKYKTDPFADLEIK